MDLAEIVNRLRHGDQDVVPLFVSVLAPTLFGYSAVVAADLGDADRELVCERALERAARRIDAYDPAAGPISRWVLPFIRHAAADLRRGPGTTVPLDDEEDVAVVGESLPSVSAAQADALLAILPRHDRLLLTLRYTERLTFAEIAVAIGGEVTEAAVRQRHARLLRKVRAAANELLEGTTR